MADRKFSAWLSDDAYEGWAEAAHTHRTNMTRLAESLGLVLYGFRNTPTEKVPEPWRSILRSAAEDHAATSRKRGRRNV